MTIAEAVRWSDNTDQLRRNLAQGLDMIESTRQGAEKMVQAMRGDKLIESAHRMTAAISLLDRGVKSLSPQEAAQKLSLLERALDKLERTGRPIPSQMKATADALRQVAAEANVQPSAWQRADAALGKFGLSLRSLGVAGVTTTLIGLGKSAIAMAGQLTDLSAQTGLGVQELQRLTFAGEQVGVSMDTIARGVNRLQQSLVQGDAGTVGAVNKLGLSLDNLQRMAPGQMFETIARSIAQIPDPAQRTAIAMELLGRSGADLLPLMTANLDELQRGFIGMSDAAIEAADRFDDMLAKWKLQAKGIVGEVVGAMARHGNIDPLTLMWQEMTRRTREMAQMPDISRMIPGAPSLFGGDPIKRSLDLAKESARATKDVAEAIRKAESEARRLQQIEDRMFGRDLIARALDFTGRLKAISDIEKMLPEQQATVLDSLNDAIRAYERLGETAPAELMRVRNALTPLVAQNRLLAATTSDAFDLMLKTRNLGRRIDLFRPSLATAPLDLGTTFAAATRTSLTKPGFGRLLAQDLADGIRGFSGQLGRVVLDAITGGGDVGRAAGTLLGQQLGASLARTMGPTLNRVLGPTLGRFVADLVPVVGGMLGSVVGWLFGPSWRDQVDAFAQRVAGSMDGLRDKMRALGAEGERLWTAITEPQKGSRRPFEAMEQIERSFEALERAQASIQSGLDGMTDALQRFGGVAPRALQPLINALLESERLTESQRKLLEGLSGAPSIDRLREAAESFGLTLNDLGPALGQLNLTDTFDQLFSKATMLLDADADPDTLFRAMADQINEAIERARKMGLAIPEFMRPMLQRMLEMGLLTDEFGKQMDTLSGLTFSDTLLSSLDKLRIAIEELVKLAREPLLPVIPDPSEVIPPGSKRSAGASVETTTVVQLDGQVLARAVAFLLPGEVQRLRLAP